MKILAVASQKSRLEKTIFEYPKQMFALIDKKIISQLCAEKNPCLSGPMVCNVTGPNNWE